MNSWLIVIPSINKEWSLECMNSLKDDSIKFYSMIIDNSEKNHGVAGAWNMGMDAVIEKGIDWLVVCSESMRFGPQGAKDIQSMLDASKDNEMVAEAEFGWHLIAFRRELLLEVGYFDETFHPAYFEDNDYIYRTTKIKEQQSRNWILWKKYHVDGELIGTAQGLKHLNYGIDFGSLREKYIAKWGGSPVEVYDHPYNNEQYSLRYAERVNR